MTMPGVDSDGDVIMSDDALLALPVTDKGKKLLVLDMDETLIHATMHDNYVDARRNGYYIFAIKVSEWVQGYRLYASCPN